jgi:hypothetical protein
MQLTTYSGVSALLLMPYSEDEVVPSKALRGDIPVVTKGQADHPARRYRICGFVLLRISYH